MQLRIISEPDLGTIYAASQQSTVIETTSVTEAMTRSIEGYARDDNKVQLTEWDQLTPSRFQHTESPMNQLGQIQNLHEFKVIILDSRIDKGLAGCK